MPRNAIREPRVLAIAPSVSGVAYVLFHGPWLPLDWGIKWTKTDKNIKGVEKVAELLEKHDPDVLVLEDYGGKGSRRAKRVEDLLDAVMEVARSRKVEVHRYVNGGVKTGHVAA